MRNVILWRGVIELNNFMSKSNNKRLAKNTLFISIQSVVVMLVSLYTSRVILASLGIEDFGIYNVVGGVVSLFAFLNGAMSSASQRYIAYEIGQGGKNVTKVFSSCLLVHFFLAILILLFAETIGLYILNNYLTIPASRIVAANWVYQFSILSCMVMIISCPFNGALVAFERMEVYAYVGIFDALLRLTVAYQISHQGYDRLIVYGLLLFGVQLIMRMFYTFYCRLKLKQIRFSFYWNQRLIRELLGFMGWTTCNNMSIIACTQGVNLVLNMFFNPIVNAARAVSMQVENATKMLSANFNLALNPQIVKSYSQEDYERFFSLIYRGSKLSFFILLTLSFPILNHLPNLLELWLGKGQVPQYTVEFTQILILIALVNALSDPLVTAVSSNGRIKWFQIVSGFSLLMILPISGIVFYYVHRPVMIFIIYLLMSVFVYLFRLWYCKWLLGMNLQQYILKVWLRSGLLLICTLVSYVLYIRMMHISGIMMFISMFLEVIFIIGLIIVIGLTTSEKIMIFNYVRKFCKKA